MLHVPRHRLNTYDHRAFAMAGPSPWNSVPDPVRNPNSTQSCFQAPAKDIFVRMVLAHPALSGVDGDAPYKLAH